MTTPGAMTHTRPGWRTPEGMRFRMVFSPFTTSVCPALFPPWKRTTTSASAASRSTTFPFPSSPHWAPITSVADMGSEAEQVRGDDVRHGAQLGERGVWDGIVDVDERERHAAHALAAELDAGDVDRVAAEEHADVADHPGHVAIVQHEDVALGHGLHPEVVHLRQADRSGAEDRPGDDGL